MSAIVKRVPLISLRQAVFSKLKSGQNHAVYGGVDNDTPAPYIVLGQAVFKPDGAKSMNLWSITLDVDCYVDHNDLATLNEMLDDVSTLLSVGYPQMVVADFQIIKCEIDTIQTFPDGAGGHHGVVVALFSLGAKPKEV